IAPVVVPFALIAADATVGLFKKGDLPAGLAALLHFLGNKNVALSFGALIGVWLQAREKKVAWNKLGSLCTAPLETGAVIILIVSAGGAYGAMIKNAGVGDCIR